MGETKAVEGGGLGGGQGEIAGEIDGRSVELGGLAPATAELPAGEEEEPLAA